MLKKQLNTLLCTAALCLLSMASTVTHAAGFHYQLNLTARLATTPAGELSGIEMSWLYDPELSAALMEGEDLSEAKREKTLQTRAADILSGLQPYQYFTTLYLDKNPLETLEVQQYNLQLTDNDQLQLNLMLPLEKSQALQHHVLEVVVSDPTAVGLATFLTEDKLLLSDSLLTICGQPTLTMTQYEKQDGHLLASETMTINCQ